MKVLEVETVKLTPELRRRLPFLGHLPIHCDVSFVEIDMTGLVSEATAAKFQEGARAQLFRCQLFAVLRGEQHSVILLVVFSYRRFRSLNAHHKSLLSRRTSSCLG